MSTAMEKQEFGFQTEIKQLLQILSHSLYQNREIAIRELISNASDSLDKLRYLQLTDEKFRDEAPLVITLEPDKEARILTIRDNGIGLTRDELIEHLGTIAHSGSLEFLNKLSGDAKKDLSLIGQFGVGFYSAFMLADKVEVVTRSYQEESGWRWESDGSGRFTIEPVADAERGAAVRLHLKADLDEFTEPYRLKGIVRKYSTFVPHSIMLEGEALNEQRPIWVEPKAQVTQEQYDQFYQHLTHRVDEKPLWHLHQSSDLPIQFHSILYCPRTNYELMGFGHMEHGLHLCAKRILVQDDCRDLLPEYLRFLYGLVDSADLPLNVSRETLQDNTILRKISKVLVKKVLDHLASFGEEKPLEYLEFYKQFGMNLRTGVGTDYENRERIGKLLRFPTSALEGAGELTSLADYVRRAPESQKQIYFLTGPDRNSILRNPNYEICRRKQLEVLFLTDPVDEMVLSHLEKFDDRELVSIDSADVQFPDTVADEKEEENKPEPAEAGGFSKVLELFRGRLGEKVAEVRESHRLTDSPCCLVTSKSGMSLQVQKVLSMNNKDFAMDKQILEVNPTHPLIKRLAALSGNSEHTTFIEDCGEQLFANAAVMEGLIPDPEALVKRTQQFMDDLAGARSPIIGG